MPSRRLAAALAVAVASVVALGTSASADTTLDRRIAPASGSGYLKLQAVKGEKYQVREGGSANARKGRARDRRSLLLFAQLTDPQIADEMSPARVDFADSAGGEIKSSWRPQEAMGLQVFDQTVRSVNANRRSPVKQGNDKRAKLKLAITTGDLADNQQLNETEWFRTVLDGGVVDPFSGRAISTTNPCGGTTPAQVSALNAAVADRQYTGVQDYDDYAAAPADRKAGFWDPDAAAAGGPYAAFPRYPGLMERAQAPFVAAGLDVPWYISRGNHDGLIQGNAAASTDLFRAIAVGCLKVFPSAAFDPGRFVGASDDELFAAFGDPAFISTLLASGRPVPPDPARRIISKAEYRRVIGTGRKHGFGYTPKAQLDDSEGTASYYAFTRNGVRFISLDTVAEGGGQSGNLDDPQYRWLRAELKRARKNDELAVAFGHHTLGTMDNTPQRRAGGRVPARRRARLRPRPAPLDAAPPRHEGQEDREGAVRGLSEPDRVRGRPHARQRGQVQQGQEGPRFWEINTASHIDWPQQSRLIEIMDNRDGTLSLFGTLLDHAARGRRARPRPGERVLTRPARLAGAHAVVQRPAARGARGHRGRRREVGRAPRPQRRAAGEGSRARSRRGARRS